MSLMDRVGRALGRRSFDYHLRQRYREYLASVDPDREPVIVFQMGKVGSSSLNRTLTQYCPDHEVFQVHVLSPEWIQTVESQLRAASKSHGRPLVHSHLLASRYLAERLSERPAPGKRWKVISMVRDPVARNISAFFQSFGVYFSADAAREGRVQDVPVDVLRRRFLEEFGDHRHRVPIQWFQSHMQPVFGIDVYAQPFDTAAGYQIYGNEQCELLLLRTEDIDAVLCHAIDDFLGVKLPGVESDNLASSKKYAGAYDDFARGFDLPESYLDELYGSAYARHFYTDAELQAFRSRWSGSRTSNSSLPQRVSRADNPPIRLLRPLSATTTPAPPHPRPRGRSGHAAVGGR